MARCLAVGVPLHAFHGCQRTSLHMAAMNSTADIARMLLDAGAEVDAGDKPWQTPLFYAAGVRQA